MITGAQLRAARGLLDWTRQDLAKAANISQETVKNIEHGVFRPQEATAEAIVKAFAAHHVEFTDNEGVQRAKDNIITLNGREGFLAFMDDIYHVAQMPYSLNGEKSICTCNVDDALFKECLGDFAEEHFQRMKAIQGLEIRILATKEESNPVGNTAYRIHKYLPDQGASVPFYVYGDRLAIINFAAENAPKIVIINSEVVAQSYRDQFKLMWEMASERPTSKAKSAQ